MRMRRSERVPFNVRMKATAEDTVSRGGAGESETVGASVGEADEARGVAAATGVESAGTVRTRCALRSRESSGVSAAEAADAAVDVSTAQSMTEATGGAEKALKKLGAAVRKSDAYVRLQKRQLFDLLELEDEFLSQEEELRAEAATIAMLAESAAGDRVKYKHAARQMQRRWELYLDLYDKRGEQPSLEMVKLFTTFMYTSRQRRSSAGRQGLGDSVAVMAEYTLAQEVFQMMEYEEWKDLNMRERKINAAPFRDAIHEQWARLKRAKPEMQSAAKPFVKEKWDERAYCIVQVCACGAHCVRIAPRHRRSAEARGRAWQR